MGFLKVLFLAATMVSASVPPTLKKTYPVSESFNSRVFLKACKDRGLNLYAVNGWYQRANGEVLIVLFDEAKAAVPIEDPLDDTPRFTPAHVVVPDFDAAWVIVETGLSEQSEF